MMLFERKKLNTENPALTFLKSHYFTSIPDSRALRWGGVQQPVALGVLGLPEVGIRSGRNQDRTCCLGGGRVLKYVPRQHMF